MSNDNWKKLKGQSLGTSDWFAMDQDRINQFADATLDHQFIHVDPEAAAQTPFGGTIAHGLLTLSLIPHFLYHMLAPHQQEGSTFVNYGCDRLRFLHPVASDAEIRCHVELQDYEQKDVGKTLLRLATTVEIKGVDKPALVAESLLMVLH